MIVSSPEGNTEVGRIWKNAAWLAAIPLVLNFVSLLSTAFIARTLGTAAFGRFSMASAVVGLSVPIADLGLRALAVRELARAGSRADRVLSELLSLKALLAILATIVIWCVAMFVSAGSGLAPVILVTSMTIIPGSLAGTLTDGLMAHDRARAISKAAFWSGTILTILSVAVVAHWPTATALASAYVAGPVVNLLVLRHYCRLEYGALVLHWRPRRWRVLLRHALPFFRLGIFSMLISQLDTLLVGSILGQAVAGIYSAAIRLADRLYVLVDSVASAVLPTLTRFKGEPRRIEDMLARVMFPFLAIISSGTMMAAAGSTALVTLLFGPAYSSGGPVLAVALLCLPALALDVLLSEGFLALRRESFVLLTAVRGQVVTLILLPPSTLFLGMLGARLSRAIGVLVSAIPRYHESRLAFPGLWKQDRVRRLVVSVSCAIPMMLLLVIRHLHPFVTVTIAFAGFIIWLVAFARLSGGFEMLKALLKARNTQVDSGLQSEAEDS